MSSLNPTWFPRSHGEFTWLFAGLALMASTWAGTVSALGQTGVSEEIPPPLPAVVVSFGGVERALQELGAVFEAAGRPEATEAVYNAIATFGGDLKGIDRTKPIGFMLFLEPGLPPQPTGVFFIPVENLNDLMGTLGLGPLKPQKKPGTEDAYELRGRRRSMHVKAVGDYVYVSQSESIIEEDLPDPLETFAGFVSRYDLAASFQVRNIPQPIRDVFATMLRTQAETELQQRDDESDAAYQIRKANGLSTTELMEQVLRQGEQITLGLDASADGTRAVVDLLVDAEPDSEFAKYLKNIAGKGSMFEPVLQEDQPLSVSLSWTMDRREQEGAAGFFRGVETALTEKLAPEFSDAVARLFEPIRATISRGHADAFMQFAPQDRDEMVVIGGIRVIGGQSFGAALRDVISAIAEDPEIKVRDVTLNIEEHGGATFHRITPGGSRDADERLYGGRPDIYLGADSRALWFAIGGAGALPTLYEAMDAVNGAQPGLRPTSLAPFQAVFRLAPWLRLPPGERDDANARALAEEAIEGADDAIRLEVRPTDTGMRMRLQFDDGFVRLFGLILAQQITRENR